MGETCDHPADELAMCVWSEAVRRWLFKSTNQMLVIQEYPSTADYSRVPIKC